MQPLKLGPSKEISQLEIRPTTADQMIRWGQGKIPSTLALLSELCDVPEKVLRQLPSGDFDRVMMALINIMPAVMKADFEQGHRPLATPEEDLPAQEQLVPAPDQIDPRFPAVDGPVVRMPPGPVIQQPSKADDAAPMNMMPPNAARPVH